MGVTCDIIPLLAGEDPDRAVARIYGGDPRLDDDPSPPTAAPEEAFIEWRRVVIERLSRVWDWQHEAEYGTDYFWTPTFGWQFEINSQDVTLRWRKAWNIEDGPAPDDGELLAIFSDLNCVFVYPDAEAWVSLDGPDAPTDLNI